MFLSKIDAKYIKLACVAGLVIIIDQVTKAAILSNLPVYSSIEVVPGFFSLTHILNPGGAFGFLSNQSSGLINTIFLFVILLALCLIFYFYMNTPKKYTLLATGFALIFGGAIGNMIDRIRFGKVVDFIDLYMGNFHWPAFNVADSAIFVGIVIFLFHLLFRKIPE